MVDGFDDEDVQQKCPIYIICMPITISLRTTVMMSPSYGHNIAVHIFNRMTFCKFHFEA